MSLCLVYMTAADLDEARRIGRSLVDNGLAACVNLIGGMRSLYRWEGELREEGEVVVLAKTRRSRVVELVTEVKRLHSYDCPCIVTLPIEDGEPEFLAWIASQTQVTPEGSRDRPS